MGLGLYAMDARQYDPAIGRFTSIDPIVHHSQSTYAAFDNNPAFWADPSGAAAVYNWEGANKGQYTDGGKVVDFSTAMASHGLNSDGSEKTSEDDGGNVAKPLTKSVLLQYVKENYCEDCSSGKLQQVTGQFFERQFEAFASGVTPSKFKFRKGTKLYGPRNTVPDFIADFIREYKSGRAPTRVQGAVAYEVKAMNGSLYLSSNTNQLMGHIDNLSDKFRFMSSYGKPHLTLATTYDVNIGTSVTNRAAEKGVGLNQVVSYYTMVNNQMIITFGPRVDATEIQNAIKN
jgi:hypothetical protein